MFISKILPFIKLQIKLCQGNVLFRFKWESADGKIISRDNNTLIGKNNRIWLALLTYTLLTLYNGLRSLLRNDLTTSQKILSLTVTIIYVNGFILLSYFYLHGKMAFSVI